MCKSKIHRATVTGADLDHIGFITIDPVLMESADLLEYEQVAVVNANNGARFETYRPRFIFVDEHNRISRDALRAVGT